MTDVGVRRYRALLGIRGVRAPLVLSTLGSIPIGMYGLAILLLVRDMDRSFGEAGLLVGVFSLANAFGAVAQGRFMDRFGQTGVLRVAACAHLPALIGLVVAARADAPTWVLAAVRALRRRFAAAAAGRDAFAVEHARERAGAARDGLRARGGGVRGGGGDGARAGGGDRCRCGRRRSRWWSRARLVSARRWRSP